MSPVKFRLNTITKIGLGWCVCIAGGIGLFVLSKQSIDRRRYEHMKIRERIVKAGYDSVSSTTEKK